MNVKRSHASTRSRRPHFSYAAPLQQPPSNDHVPGINPGTQNDNQQAAKRLKLMLELDHAGEGNDSGEEKGSDNGAATTKHARFEALYGVPSHYMNSMLAKAYRESYRRHKIDPEEYGEAEKDAAESDIDSNDLDKGINPSSQSSSQTSAKHLDGNSGEAKLMGEEAYKKKTTKNKDPNHRQKTGVGVIGQPFWIMQNTEGTAELSEDENVKSKQLVKLLKPVPPTKIAATSLGCDIPMPFKGNPSVSQPMLETLKKARFPYQLDPSLPPLALEHPVRIWNVIFQSLEPEVQPVVKWSFNQNVMREGKI